MAKWFYVLLIFLAQWCLLVHNVEAQKGSNPFEIENRMDSVSLQTSGSAKVDNLTNNPFDKKKVNTIAVPEKTVVQLPEIHTKISLSSSTWFWILLFVTLLVAIIINLNRTIITNLMKAWSNVNYSNLLHRDKKGSDRIQYVFLEVVFYINLAITLTLGHQLFFLAETSFSTFFLAIAIVTSIYCIRHTFLYILAKTFSIAKEALQYSFTINLFNIINGIVLLILNYFIAFGPSELAKILFFVAIGFIVLQLIYRGVRGLLLSARYMFNDQIHFFLYLCSCEIIPFVVGAVYISQMN